jgi:hypothetical protein
MSDDKSPEDAPVIHSSHITELQKIVEALRPGSADGTSEKAERIRLALAIMQRDMLPKNGLH